MLSKSAARGFFLLETLFFSVVKGFDDFTRLGLRRLHAISPAGYTRIGPAIRYALALMDRSGARRRLVLRLTDAKPTDYDQYEGRCGVEDVRQALREAADDGVHCRPRRFVGVASDILRS